jgi:hypothetical protein
MQSIILGSGEIGTSLHKVIGGDITGKTDTPGEYDIIHICFPYDENFISEVKRYQELYKCKYTIIHSTVPVGTSRKCNAIHSPCVGVHPYLEKSLRTFIKFLGGEQADEVADYFRRHGMKVYITDMQETTELAKLSQTTQYALNIEYVKEFKKECDKYNVPFECAYTLFSQNYNEGYEKLNLGEYKLPLLLPQMQKQGGHCTLPNCKIWDTFFTKIIRDLNK